MDIIELIKSREQGSCMDVPMREATKQLQTEKELIKGLIGMALSELDVPNKDYPAPVSNAVDFLREALKG